MRTLTTLALVLLSSLLPAQTGFKLGARDPSKGQASRTVGSFCQMDFFGFRLTEDGAKKMLPLTTWKEMPQHRVVTVVDRYQITGVREADGRLAVSVGYARVGVFEDRVGFSSNSQPESLEFTLAANSDGQWRIVESTGMSPHVSRRVLAKRLREQLAAVTDPQWKAELERTIDRLEY